MCNVVTLKRTLVFVVVLLGAMLLIWTVSPALRMNTFLNHYGEQGVSIFYIGEGVRGGVDCPIKTCPECETLLRELLDSLSDCSYTWERPSEWMYDICIQKHGDGTWIDATIVGDDVYFSVRHTRGVYRSAKAAAFRGAVKKVLEFEVDGVKIDIRSPIFKP